MMRIPLARRVAALLIVLAATVPLAATAASHRSVPRSSDDQFATAPIAWVWSWLTSIWEKNGCMIDPSGRCLLGTGIVPTLPAGTDNGCGIDPSGRCMR